MSRPIHFEILVDDLDRAQRFYEAVLGWQFSAWDGGPPYRLVTTGPDGAPGINGAIMGRELPQGVINTMAVDDLGAAMARVRDAGGEVVIGPNTIPGVGEHAYCKDTEGNWFGLLQPAAGGAPPA